LSLIVKPIEKKKERKKEEAKPEISSWLQHPSFGDSTLNHPIENEYIYIYM